MEKDFNILKKIADWEIPAKRSNCSTRGKSSQLPWGWSVWQGGGWVCLRGDDDADADDGGDVEFVNVGDVGDDDDDEKSPGFGRLTPQLSFASYSNNEEGQVIDFLQFYIKWCSIFHFSNVSYFCQPVPDDFQKSKLWGRL